MKALGDIISVVTALGFLGYAAVKGFMQRRPFWTRQSWWRFGTVCAFGVLLCFVAIAMGEAVDQFTSPDGKSLYILATTGLLLAGACIFGGVMSWFALGDPERPFPGAAKRDPSPINQSAPVA